MKNIFKTFKMGLFLVLTLCGLQGTSFAMQQAKFTAEQMLDALLHKFEEDTTGKTVQQIRKSEILGILSDTFSPSSAALAVPSAHESVATPAVTAATLALDRFVGQLYDPRHSLPTPPTITTKIDSSRLENAELYDGSSDDDNDSQIALTLKRNAVHKWHAIAQARKQKRYQLYMAQIQVESATRIKYFKAWLNQFRQKRAATAAMSAPTEVNAAATQRPVDKSKLRLLRRRNIPSARSKYDREIEFGTPRLSDDPSAAVSAVPANPPAQRREISALDFYIPPMPDTATPSAKTVDVDEELARALQNELNGENHHGAAARHTATAQKSAPNKRHTTTHHAATAQQPAHYSARTIAPANRRQPSYSAAVVAQSRSKIPKPAVRSATLNGRPVTATVTKSFANARTAATASSAHSAVQNPTAKMLSDLDKCIPVLQHHMLAVADEAPYTSILKPAITNHMSSIKSLGELTDATEMLEAIKNHAHKLAFKNLKAVYDAVDQAMTIYNKQTAV